jgi:hypothetical protein
LAERQFLIGKCGLRSHYGRHRPQRRARQLTEYPAKFGNLTVAECSGQF